jgi:hypothetical protein
MVISSLRRIKDISKVSINVLLQFGRLARVLPYFSSDGGMVDEMKGMWKLQSMGQQILAS